MNVHIFTAFYFLYRAASVTSQHVIQSCVFLLVFFCSLSLITTAQANELQVKIVDSWVEDGYVFHFDIQLPPYNVYCSTTGEGFIGFDVYYKDKKSLQEDLTFGLAPWPEGLVSDSKVVSHLTAYGPQAFCTKFSPCTIQHVQMAKAWCPPLE